MASASVSRLQLLATALLFSTGGAAIKAAALTGWQVASFRSLTAGTAIFFLVPASRRDWTRRTVAVGVAYAATLVLYVLANKLTTAANAIFLQYTAPLYLILLGPWLLRERIRRSDITLLAALAAGMALFFLGRQEPFLTAPDPLSGNVLAALSGASWALTVAGLRWIEGKGSPGERLQPPPPATMSSDASGFGIRERNTRVPQEPGMSAVVAGNLAAGLFCLPKALPVAGAGAADWLVIMYLGVFQIGLAYAFLTRAVRRIPALEASLLMMAEPAINPLWAWILHGERPGALALTGGALILTATLARTVIRRDGR